MNTYPEISDFTFMRMGYEVYDVTYKDPVTGKKYTAKINDMTIIDLMKDAPDDLRLMDNLKILKFICVSMDINTIKALPQIQRLLSL